MHEMYIMVKRLQICSFIVKICKSVCFLKAKENTQSMQLSRKGKGYANFDVFWCFYYNMMTSVC